MTIPQGEYGLYQDAAGGGIFTLVGPMNHSLSGSDSPVVQVDGRFQRCDRREAILPQPVAGEADYIVLRNPCIAGKNPAHPNEGSKSTASPELQYGVRTHIKGPARFALYPGQEAEVIKGHSLRSNEYLIARVYNAKAAMAERGTVIARKQEDLPPSKDLPPTGNDPETMDGLRQTLQAQIVQNVGAGPTGNTVHVSASSERRELRDGQLLIIKGTDVSLYIPPTGIEVLRTSAQAAGSTDPYTRQAATLERLEYVILVEENGNKRYEEGPQVVFPEPTEGFVTRNGSRIFKAIELNDEKGIHIKLTSDCAEGKKGEELFITGKQQKIYIPKPEHSIVSHDGESIIHFAVAVPAGSARYLLNKHGGNVDTVVGPAMLLPNPISFTHVKRALTEAEVALWFPGNREAEKVNQALRGSANKDGVVSPTRRDLSFGSMDYCSISDSGSSASSSNNLLSSYTRSERVDEGYAGDMVSRKSEYTPPRTITIDDKYEGAVRIRPFAGYAVQVVDRSGKSRVVLGPETINLAFDETLEKLTFSCGPVKGAGAPKKSTVYLRVANNQVGNVVSVRTRDLVDVDVSVSFRVNFDPEHMEKWFNVENYVRLLADHTSSLLRGAVCHHDVAHFVEHGVDIIRDTILGVKQGVWVDAGSKEVKEYPVDPQVEVRSPKPDPSIARERRPGRFFPENGMRITDVEIRQIEIKDREIHGLLIGQQREVVRDNLIMVKQQRQFRLKEQEIELQNRTRMMDHALALAERHDERVLLEDTYATSIWRREAEHKEAGISKETAALNAAEQRILNEEEERHDGAISAIEIEAFKGRYDAMGDKLADALAAVSRTDLAKSLTDALAKQSGGGGGLAALLGPKSVGAISEMVRGTPMEGAFRDLASRNGIPSRRNGDIHEVSAHE